MFSNLTCVCVCEMSEIVVTLCQSNAIVFVRRVSDRFAYGFLIPHESLGNGVCDVRQNWAE